MTREDFKNVLYRLQAIQQMAVEISGITFKIDTFTTRDRTQAIEWMLQRNGVFVKSGTITEDSAKYPADVMVSELKDFVTKYGWL